MKEENLSDLLENPTRYQLVCPECKSSCNIKYVLGLSPILELEILPHFYCPSHRYVKMEVQEIPIALPKLSTIIKQFSEKVRAIFINQIPKKLYEMPKR